MASRLHKFQKITKKIVILLLKHLIMNTFQNALISKAVETKHFMNLTMKQINYPSNHYMPFYPTLLLKHPDYESVSSWK